MAQSPSLQRVYKAPCPGCGAPIEFRSAQSTHAVCGYCQSTVVRNGETLSRIGKMAELFDDYSPLQLYAAGRWTDKGRTRGFSVIGRLQYKSSSGAWSDWQLAFDDGGTGSLSEDNGSFVLSTPIALKREVPDLSSLQVGRTTAFDGVSYQVTTNDRAALMSALGELPKLPPLGQEFDVVELRNADGQVLSLDGSQQPSSASIGVQVALDDLKLTGLKDQSSKEDIEGKGRQFNCPNCGSPVSVALDTSKSVTCGSCNSLIDVSQGIGGELRHAIQNEPVKPLIAVGSTGELQGSNWQVVGFQHRVGHEPGDDEHFGWSEYLLYNTRKGFCFLVDSEEGWSLVRPTTGAPNTTSTRQSATYQGKRFDRKYQYEAKTDYVSGEFYWPVVRGQKTSNIDFANGKNLLSLEQSAKELTWSIGTQIDAAVVAKAFGLDAKSDLFKRTDVAPTAANSKFGCLTIIIVCVIIFILLSMLSRCSNCDPNLQDCRSSASGGTYRSSGGSFGGFSGGGGHK